MTLKEKCDLIVENLDTNRVKQLLTQLEIPYQDKPDYILCKTMCHHTNEDEASWKLYYYKNNHIFMCYTSCGGMSIFNFLKNYYKTREYEYDWYEDIFRVAENCTLNGNVDFEKTEHQEKKSERYRKRDLVALPTYSPGILDVFVKTYPVEWLNDGISKAAMDKFNIKYSIPQNKIIIPHYDANGMLVGIRGRALNDWEVEMGAKYMPVQVENTWYTHKLSLNLYGLDKNKENIKENGICYIFESEKSVLQCESFSFPNCAVAVCGSALNIFQIKLLMRECHPKEIVLCFDKEELPGEDTYYNKLKKICEKYKNYCNFSFLYDREDLLDLKDSPSDKGEETFIKLLNRRRRIK